MGIYECFLFLSFVYTTAFATLKTSGSSSYAVENHKFVLSCESSVEVAYIVWMRNDRDIAHIHMPSDECDLLILERGLNYVYNCTDNKTFKLIIPGNRILQEDGSKWQCYDMMYLSHSEKYTLTVAKLPTSDPVITGYSGIVLYPGNTISLICTVQGGTPSANVSWTCEGSSVTGTYKDTSTAAINEVILSMLSSSNGQTCLCKAEHLLWTTSKTTESQQFVVYFPPTVSLFLSTPLVERRKIDITCIATGNPDKYFYTGWTQMYGGIVIRRGLNFGSLTADNSRLTLTDLSYQDIGVYTCTAHNTVKDRNGVLEQHGSACLDVKFSAIFKDKSQNKFYAEHCHQLGIEILFFSNPFLDKSSITIIKTDRNNTQLGRNRYSLTMEPTDLSLKFHGKNVNVNAQRAVIAVHSFQKDDTGNYNVIFKITDRLTSTFRIDLLLSRPPEQPKNFAMLNKTETTITVTWISGSNGGYPQTFVILNIPVNSKERPMQVKVNEKEHQQNYHYTLKNLVPGTDYIIWIYSVNQKGNSYVLNDSFTPLKSKTEPLKNDKPNAENIRLIIGVVSAVIFGIICAITNSDYNQVLEKL